MQSPGGKHTTFEESPSNNQNIDVGLRDRLKSLNGFYVKKVGVWDAMAQADVNQWEREQFEKKLIHRSKQAELRQFYQM